MAKSIKSVFDKECTHLVFDKALAKKISTFRLSFEMRNEDHITFFGGGVTGVQVVRFLPEDRDAWFEEILQVSEFQLADELESLPSIDTSRIVTSDTMNLSFVWVMHRFYQSKLSTKEKEQAMIDTAMVMQFKFLTSRLYRHFRFPADKAVAEATYAQLNYKYAIKQYGSWKELLLARSRDIISHTGIHGKAIEEMRDDDKVTYVLSDSQGRIRELLKNIYDMHLRVRNQNSRIISTSKFIEYDGEIFLKDVTNNLTIYSRYLHSIVSDKNSFIKEELAEVIEKMVHTMSPRMFRKTLEWISVNYRHAGDAVIDDALSNVVLYSLDYLRVNRTSARIASDLPTMLTRLKGSFMSSRNNDELMLKTKGQFEQIVHSATGSKHPSIVASVRTGVMLYIVARTLTKTFYSTAAAK